jgi:hypothetical protein
MKNKKDHTTFRTQLLVKLNAIQTVVFRVVIRMSPSQWPLGLRHEPSSPARILGSGVRVPLEAWMSVCVYSVFVLFRMCIAALRRADATNFHKGCRAIGR